MMEYFEYFAEELAAGVFLIGCDAETPWGRPGREIKPMFATGNSYLIAGGEKALLLDSAANLPGLRQFAEGLVNTPVLLALTHAHPDHVYRLCEFDEYAVHQLDECLLRGAYGMAEYPNIPETVRYLEEGDTIELGGRTVDVYRIEGHTDGSLLFLDRQTKILFTGDSIARRLLYGACAWVPVSRYIKQLNRINGLGFERMLSAHDRIFLSHAHIERMIAGFMRIPETEKTIFLPFTGHKYIHVVEGDENETDFIDLCFPVSHKSDMYEDIRLMKAGEAEPSNDSGWLALVSGRKAKWAAMLREYEEQGIKKLPLWSGGQYRHPAGFTPGVVIYPVHDGNPRGMVIICPGGGFLFKSPNEGKDVADYFYRQGFNAAVLDYAVSEDLSAMPGGDAATRGAVLEDAKRAVRVIRHMAKNLNIKPDKIAIGGFSAGGILTSMLLTNYDSGIPDSEDEIERNSSRPDAAFHMYGSFTNAVLSPAPKGLGYDSAKRRELAASDFILNMPVDAPPIFLAQTNDDDPGNILAMGQAFYQRGVEFEIHLFTGGAHGGGLFDGKHADSPLAPHAAHWAELAAEWFEIQGF